MTRTVLRFAITTGACLLSAAPAAALIVDQDGKVVPAWPDAPVDGAPTARAASSKSLYPAPKGIIYGLTILVDFSDTPPAFTVEQVKSWLHDEGYTGGGQNGSIRDYFLDQSNGMVDFRNDVVGFVRAKQPKSYYEAGSGYSRATELVTELIQAIDATVDFSKYDNDGDGSTEAVSIVYAGPSVEFAQGLWPHAGSTREQRDGVRLSRYQMSQMGTRLGLYTFAHEVGHMLFGWPDLYGFGNYCIMGNSSSSTNPVGINDVYRADQGWIPIVDITESTNARFRAVPNAGGYRYVNPRDPGEWFFWYNQQNTGRWSSLRGNGLIVMHFDHSLRSNNPPNPLSLAVVQADGLRELDGTQWPMPGSDAKDFYPTGGKTELSRSTTPASNWNDGTASGLRIYEISASSAMMTFAVGTGTPEPGIGGATGVAGAGGAMGQAGRGSAGSSAGAAPAGGTGGDMGRGGSGGATMGGSAMGGSSGGALSAAGTSGSGVSGANTGGTAPAGSGGASGGTPGSLAGSGGARAGAAQGGTPVSAGVAGTPTSPPDSAEDGGCGCRVKGHASPRSAGALVGIALAFLLRRRRVARSRAAFRV